MTQTSIKAERNESLVETSVGTANGQTTILNGTDAPQLDVVLREDAPDDGRHVSLEEYWETWYEYGDVSYEWNNGRLEAKPLTTKTQYCLFRWFVMLLEQYEQTVQQVDVMGLETGFKMEVPDPDNPDTLKTVVRKPDVAVIRHDNQIQWGEGERSYKGICNVCVESISDSAPSEILRDTEGKYEEYLFAGVQEYYILDPENEHMHFYERTETGSYREMTPTDDGIIRSKELPGFQFRLKDLHSLPTLERLALDEVYQGYILLHYRATERVDMEVCPKVCNRSGLCLHTLGHTSLFESV